jgi:competence protein ComEC
MRIRVAGSIRPPPDGDYGRWLRRTGVSGTLRAGRSEVIALPRAEGLAGVERVRRGSDAALIAALPEPAAGLASGILIGLRERVDRGVAADFTTAGVSHVVAISGWNIAIVGATVAALLRRRRRTTRAIATAAAIVAYTAFAGGSPSVVRAASMAGVVLLARESGRAGRASAALGVAVAGLLLLDPGLGTDAGFQLSVLATAGLLAWATPVASLLGRLTGGRLPAWLTETLALSLAAQLATLPVVLATFGRLSLVSPVANVVVAPIVAPAMAAGAVALAGGWLSLLGAPGMLATVAGLPAWVLLSAMIGIVGTAAGLPYASVDVKPPIDVGAAGLVASIALAVSPAGRRAIDQAVGAARRPSRRPAGGSAAPGGSHGRAAAATGSSRRVGRRERAVALILAAGIVAVGVAAAGRPDGRIRITVLDVGQGDAILVEGDRGGRLLVDGGPDPARLLVALDDRLPPWDRRLDLVVLTHPHEDHVAGLPRILERYRVGRLFEPGMRGPGPGYAAWVDRLAARRTTVGRLATGDHLQLDSISLSVLWPDRDRVPLEPADDGRAINDVSIVLLGQVAGGRFLLTGDIEDDVDPILVERRLPRVDVLKVAHHGSRTATTDAFLAATRPAVAIVSAGEDNPYGHPAPTTIGRIEATRASLFRTDLDGTVSATFDGRTWSVSTGRPRRSATHGPPTAGPAIALGPLAFRCGIPRQPPDRPTADAAAEVPVAPPTLGYHRVDDRLRARLDGLAPTTPCRTVLAALPGRSDGPTGRRSARRAVRGLASPRSGLGRPPDRIRRRPAPRYHGTGRSPPA